MISFPLEDQTTSLKQPAAEAAVVWVLPFSLAQSHPEAEG